MKVLAFILCNYKDPFRQGLFFNIALALDIRVGGLLCSLRVDSSPSDTAWISR